MYTYGKKCGAGLGITKTLYTAAAGRGHVYNYKAV